MGASLVRYSDLDIKTLIGKGAFSEVHRAERRSGRSGVFAVKQIDLTDKHHAVSAGEEAKHIQLVTGHKNIVKFFDQAIDDGLFCMVLEYCNGGNLNDYCLTTPAPSKATTFKLCKEIADGLNYMHGEGVPHGDLKPDNILIHNSTCKISDLGFSSTVAKVLGQRDYFLKESALHVFTQNRPPFWPPEVLRRMEDLGKKKNENLPIINTTTVKQGDIFSLALVFLVVFSKQFFTNEEGRVLAPTVSDVKVYGDSTQAQIDAAVQEAARKPEGMPDLVNQGLLKMLRVEPADRIKSDDVCKQLR